MKSNYVYEDGRQTTADRAALAGLSGMPTVQIGDSGSAVRELQTLLVEAGYALNSYGIDGQFGGETLSALMQFQRDEGLPPTGVANSDTWAALKGEDSGGFFNLDEILDFTDAITDGRGVQEILGIDGGGENGASTPIPLWVWLSMGAIAVTGTGLALASATGK